MRERIGGLGIVSAGPDGAYYLYRADRLEVEACKVCGGSLQGDLVALHDLDVAPRSSALADGASLAQVGKWTAYGLLRPVGVVNHLDEDNLHTWALLTPLRVVALEPGEPVLYRYLLPPCRALCSRALILSSTSPNSFHFRSCSNARR